MIEKTPAVPKEFHARSNTLAILGCAFTFLLVFGSWWLLAELWGADIALSWKILGALPLGVLGGYGVLLAGFMGHDGTHFTLHHDKFTSCLIGIIMTAPVFPYHVMGFAISHWHHHKYTNSDRDPDARAFSKFTKLWTRALFARPYTFYLYSTNCVRLALGLPFNAAYSFPLEEKLLRRLARINLLLNAIVTVAFVATAIANPVAGLAGGLILLFGSVISGLSPYIEHNATGVGRGQDTRTSTGIWWDLFLQGNNYHIEHHLYPTVPFYRLKATYEFLKSAGYYDTPRYVTHGLVDTYRVTLGAYPYGPVFKK